MLDGMDRDVQQPEPLEALDRLMTGNDRFATDRRLERATELARLKDAAVHGQSPFATVVCCSDSRCPPEVIFDQGLGELFTVRVAGNVCGPNETASAEYGMTVLRTPLCVVLGHTGCGAVGAVVGGESLSGNMLRLSRQIQQAVHNVGGSGSPAGGDALLAQVVRENVWLSIEELLRSSGEIRRLVADGRAELVGAVLEMSSGRASWLGRHPRQAGLI